MRVLVVEDNIDIATVLKSTLEAECFAVDVANDGEKGSQMARTNDYDIIVLDKMLPKKSGLDVCREVRMAKKNCFVLILSVIDDADEKAALLNAGADDYLTKPFSHTELLARIKALMRRAKTVTSDVLTAGSLYMDTQRHIVRYHQREVTLTRKEFALLEYLLRNKGSVLSRAMIMEHVWDMHADPFSNTIEAHILSLRKKLGVTGKSRLITTVSGVGYKLLDE